jgi:uncharacterized protein
MNFEWDPLKADSNLHKHHMSFEDASRVFLDPKRIETFDGREAYGEDRWKTWAWSTLSCWRSSTQFAATTQTSFA